MRKIVPTKRLGSYNALLFKVGLMNFGSFGDRQFGI